MVKEMNIQSILEEYNNFQECIIEDIQFLNYGTKIEITFNYIWDENKGIRKDLDKKNLVAISFNLVNEFKLQNELNKSIINEPLSLNWGFNEISIVAVKKTNTDFNTIEILWESSRRIELSFVSMEIFQPFFKIKT